MKPSKPSRCLLVSDYFGLVALVAHFDWHFAILTRRKDTSPFASEIGAESAVNSRKVP